jgi:hypothetical protein
MNASYQSEVTIKTDPGTKHPRPWQPPTVAEEVPGNEPTQSPGQGWAYVLDGRVIDSFIGGAGI